jgi:hypothetical protein
MSVNSLSALPALRAFPCEICGEQIETLRLIKWRENGQVIRFWVCLECWKKIYPAEEPPQAGRCSSGRASGYFRDCG